MSESESKKPDRIKCPDCGKIRGVDDVCVQCQTPAVDKPAEEMAETKSNGEREQKTSRFSKPRILLIGIVGLALVAASVAGLFYFLKDSNTEENGPPSVTETPAHETDLDKENSEQEENSDNEMSLEDILATHYPNCQSQEDLSVGQPIVGYQKLLTCTREGANEDEAFVTLQIYTSENPGEAVAFAAAHIFCTDELGNKLFVIKGKQFLIMPIAPLDSQAVAEAQNPEDVFTLEYVQTFNDISRREQVFLKDKGLESELINACEELRPSE